MLSLTGINTPVSVNELIPRECFYMFYAQRVNLFGMRAVLCLLPAICYLRLISQCVIFSSSIQFNNFIVNILKQDFVRKHLYNLKDMKIKYFNKNSSSIAVIKFVLFCCNMVHIIFFILKWTFISYQNKASVQAQPLQQPKQLSVLLMFTSSINRHKG